MRRKKPGITVMSIGRFRRPFRSAGGDALSGRRVGNVDGLCKAGLGVVFVIERFSLNDVGTALSDIASERSASHCGGCASSRTDPGKWIDNQSARFVEVRDHG
jgi:hypothetical protein